ncbi:hypothetical protein [Pedobacter jejuensis]|uniref:Uncharacterized protein n=1 Tax=Pedobacter jejuensis TaxID=1268550 RepID=A0A3N0C1W5_9SPHI|nr:hypothetical protein [Pedobacter jejuensis]RNL55821.1 hypothetical protein D7004_03440 [Pedobacter jejuensis]
MEHKIHTISDKSVGGFISRISWSAIISGVFIAIAVQLLLSFLGLGIGFGSINPLDEAKPFSGLGTGALIWWIVTMLISVFTGGWVAGWFSNQIQKTDLIIHGLLTWCLLTFLNMYLITSSVGKIVGGVGTVITKGFSLAGDGIKAAAPEAGDLIKDQLGMDKNTFGKMKQEAELLLKQTEKKELQPKALDKKIDKAANQSESTGKDVLENPQAAQQKIDALVSKLFSENDSTFNAVDQEALVNIVKNRTGKSEAESKQIVENWVSTLKTAKEKIKEVKVKAEQKAREVGDEMASALSKFAIFSFIGMVLGAVSASFGALIASKKRLTIIETRPVERV